MLVLTIRTDKPEAEVGLFADGDKIAYEVWEAHRELSVTIHQRIIDLLEASGKQLNDLDGIIGFAGPGSFTGLRIGLAVANGLSSGLGVPILASKGDDWIQAGIARLAKGEHDTIALPEYGAPVHITKQKK
ncbi:MAG TPA: tRNA (adenosine(37)-N6)-threonylcarbamoyltransferase complex dimerization subunit type 1 TsaB [Candidatus Saccharimonadales bacterium]|nr:tRNA (adenosine(37)-N6)-threonylcarbamoyltransferase complex dimerization subunit type 1 TsaB [Candidatus Saccharimonadales bacterium]